MPRATFICGGELVPASRFRVHPIASALKRDGWDTAVIHGYGRRDHAISRPLIRRGYRATCRVRRAFQTAFLTREGPVMVQRLALPWFAGPEEYLAHRGRPLVFDFDDAVFLDASGHECRRRRAALENVCSRSAHVVTGNSWLANSISGKVPVTVIPTCLDTERYRPGSRLTGERRARLGWIGTSSNFRYLVQLIEPLNELRAEGHSVDLRICSDEVDQGLFRRLGAEYCKWSPEAELPFLQSIDIGLMPLADNAWCRGKCSFKMIQYMAVGVPVVASAVGMNIDVLEGQTCGYLVSDGDWVAPIEELLTSEGTRVSMGAKARQRAVKLYDVNVAIAAYREILDGLQ